MPHIEWWRAMPPPALLPISIVLLHSIGDRQKVSFIAFFCLFPILLNTIDGVSRHRPGAHGDRPFVRSGQVRANRQDRLPGGAAPDLRRDANEPLAGGDHDGPHRVLLEHEWGWATSC